MLILSFDARCLPNPYWNPELRGFTGKDQVVIDFLQSEAIVTEYSDDISSLLERWIPRFEQENRSYLTVAIGCTGGQHRSVFLVDSLARHFQSKAFNVIVQAPGIAISSGFFHILSQAQHNEIEICHHKDHKTTLI